MNDKLYDVMIVGGGPGGYSSAIYAAKEGLSVLLFEGGNVGGTCLNVGCIPTKYLLDKGAALEKIRKLADGKILKDSGFYSFRKIQEQKEQVVRKLTGGVEYLLKANCIDMVHGFATINEAGKASCNGKEYRARNIILATGSEPASIPVQGAEYAIDSTKALALETVPEKLAVIGGGVIGMELASAFCAFGSEVTVIEVLPELFPAERTESIKYLHKELQKKGICIMCDTKVCAIEKIKEGFQIHCEGADGRIVKADVVLMATGRKPNLKGIDTEALGLALTKKHEICVDGCMQTNVPGIYAVGDVAGGYQLAHAAYAEGETAVNHILGRGKPADLSAIPRCIYTIPPFAAVGVSAEKAKENGIQTVEGTFSYMGNGMALAEDEEGVVTVVMDADTKQTLGIQIVGAGAPEMISSAAFAVRENITLTDWQEMIVAHPSLSEMVKEAALDCFGKSIHGAVK